MARLRGGCDAPRRAINFRDVVGKLDVPSVERDKCGRCGSGIAKLFDWSDEITADASDRSWLRSDRRRQDRFSGRMPIRSALPPIFAHLIVFLRAPTSDLVVRNQE